MTGEGLLWIGRLLAHPFAQHVYMQVQITCRLCHRNAPFPDQLDNLEPILDPILRNLRWIVQRRSGKNWIVPIEGHEPVPLFSRSFDLSFSAINCRDAIADPTVVRCEISRSTLCPRS
jgi:hypothetical protein